MTVFAAGGIPFSIVGGSGSKTTTTLIVGLSLGVLILLVAAVAGAATVSRHGHYRAVALAGPGGILYEHEPPPVGLSPDELFLVDPDGTVSRSIGAFAAQGGISADGTRFVFAGRGQEGEPSNPTVESTSRTDRRQLWHVGDVVSSVALSPTGTEAALILLENSGRTAGDIIQPNETAGLWVVNVTTGTRHLVTPGARGPVTWSPDGQRVAFTLPANDSADAPAALVTAPAAGGGTTTVTKWHKEGNEGSFTLSWSPDGRTIMVGGTSPDGKKVETFPAGGGSPADIVDAPSNNVICGAVWSPSGTRIALQTSTQYSGQAITQIEVGNANGSDLRSILKTSGFCPDYPTLAWLSSFG